MLSLGLVFLFLIIILFIIVFIIVYYLNDLKNDINKLKFQQNFLVEYGKQNDVKLKEISDKNNKKINCLLMRFFNKIINIITLIRIVILRKVVNFLIINLINKNKQYLVKTKKKFNDLTKPKKNRRPFYIIYTTQLNVNGVEQYLVNIVVDFLMFIHDYTSSKIHLNELENKEDIEKFIKQFVEEKYSSSSSDENISDKKTEASLSFKSHELIKNYMQPSKQQNILKKLIEEVIKKGTIKDDIKEDIKREDSKENNRPKKRKKNKLNNKIINDINEEEEQEYEIIKQLQKKDGTVKKEQHKEKTKNENKSDEGIDEKEKLIKPKKKNDAQKRNFQNFLKILTNQKLNKDDLALIERIYYKNGPNELNINTLIELYKNNSNEISKLKSLANQYQDEVDNTDININEEFLIENILKNYKLQFDQKSEIYSNIKLDDHYRFNDSYKNIIAPDRIKNLDLNEIMNAMIKLTNVDFINLLAEDPGNFGDKLEEIDI